MYHLPWFLASRSIYYMTTNRHLSRMLVMCLMTIALTSASLTVVSSLMHGVHTTLTSQLKTTHADIEIRSKDPLNITAIRTLCHEKFPEMTGISSHMHKDMLISSPHTDETYPLVLIGIDPVHERQTTQLERTIINTHKNKPLSDIKDNHIMIGKAMAHLLNVSVGDTVELLFVDQLSKKNHVRSIETVSAYVQHIFATGIEDVDSTMAYAHHDFFQSYLPDDRIDHVLLSAPSTHISHILTTLKDITQLPVYHWSQLYPALFSALRLERYLMLFIMILIMLIANMTLIAFITMHMTYKQKDFALFRALGAHRSTPYLMALYLGTSLAICGTIIGIGIGMLFLALFNQYQPHILPLLYYTDSIPIEINYIYLLSIIGTSLCMGIISAYWIVYATNKKSVAYLLTYHL